MKSDISRRKMSITEIEVEEGATVTHTVSEQAAFNLIYILFSSQICVHRLGQAAAARPHGQTGSQTITLLLSRLLLPYSNVSYIHVLKKEEKKQNLSLYARSCFIILTVIDRQTIVTIFKSRYGR